MKYKDIGDKVCRLVTEKGLEDKVIVSSFNHQSIKRIKREYPKIKCGIIVVSYMVNPVEYTRSIGAEFYHPLLETATEELCHELSKNGIKVNAWTDSQIESLKEINKLGLYGLISDYPEDVTRLLGK